MKKKEEFEYPLIDLKKTGEWLRVLCKHYGYSVKDLQEYLHISSNQAIYEWFNGHTLPSVNNLLALSMLLNISINLLLVDNIHDVIYIDESEYAKYLIYIRCKQYILLMNADNVVRVKKHGA